MRRILLLMLLHLITKRGFAQQPEISGDHEYQLEQAASTSDESSLSAGENIQLSEVLGESKIDINKADEEALYDLLLSETEVMGLLEHRLRFGPLLNVCELQSVDGWSLSSIRRILPFITISGESFPKKSIKDWLTEGSHRISMAGAFSSDADYDQEKEDSLNRPQGSPLKFNVRYKYSYNRFLQFGVLGEKDAGESFFRGTHQNGFDFYSAHFFLRNRGRIKSLVLGDYVVNMGQGLIQWQGMAFHKGPDITCVKHISPIIKPYHSFGENYFYRGVAISLGIRSLSFALFASVRKLDAVVKEDSSSNGSHKFIRSFITSGYHRSLSEWKQQGVVNQLAAGSNISLSLKKIRVGLNAVSFKNQYPIVKTSSVYELDTEMGKSQTNFSIDYAYTGRNAHWFGEAAIDKNFSHAIMSGVLLSVSGKADVSLLYRNFSLHYQSMYVNVFAENYRPENERGFFTGISLRPDERWQLSGYLDLFHFPWMKYRVYSPSYGKDGMVRVLFKPRKTLEIYAVFQRQKKSENIDNEEYMKQLTNVFLNRFRFHINQILAPGLSLRFRTEITRCKRQQAEPLKGFLIYGDLIFKPMQKPFSVDLRFQYFQGTSYDSRIYAYENDFPGSFSIPAFYSTGYRYYLYIRYAVSRKLVLHTRYARSVALGPDRGCREEFKLMATFTN